MDGAGVILTAFLTAAVTSAGTVYVVEKYNIIPHAQAVTEVVVPDLHGITEADARANAAVAHIGILVAAREPTPDAKPGTVVRQSINAGQRVPRDHPVSIVLAEEVPRVPSITGITLPEATQRLEQRGYTIQLTATVPDNTVAHGLVIDQTPKAETAHVKGGTVTVRVSSGPGEVELPKFIGVGFNQAKTDIEKMGLKSVVRWVAMAETPTYVVLNQKPPAGEKVKPGAEITLTVCR
jgi:eukaryotic-like serine/threonine-protein kinase